MAKSKSGIKKSNQTNNKTVSKKDIKKQNHELIESKANFSPEIKKSIWIVGIVVVVLVIAYLIAYQITKPDTPTKSEEETTVQYSEILVGSSFNRSEAEYIVVYYDMTDTDSDDYKNISNSVIAYNYSSDKPISLYTCDLGNAFNKSYNIKEEPNTNPKNASELNFNGPTVIKFSNGSVKEYIRGAEAVQKYINSLLTK